MLLICFGAIPIVVLHMKRFNAIDMFRGYSDSTVFLLIHSFFTKVVRTKMEKVDKHPLKPTVTKGIGTHIRYQGGSPRYLMTPLT